VNEASRVLRPHAAARSAYDRMSGFYDWLTAGESAMRSRLLRMAELRGGELVLDLGSGTGTALKSMAHDTGEHGLAVGFDLSAGMLSRAAANLRRSSAGGRVRLVQGDAVACPFVNGAFDLILMSFSLELFDTPEIPRVLDECRRMLSSGGRLAIGCLATRPVRRWPVRLYETLHDRFPAWLDCRPIPVRAMLGEAGLRAEQVAEAALWGLPVDLVVARV
jgi:ubiquinone/menaquinone biosynthesis C-methylase UbiE